MVTGSWIVWAANGPVAPASSRSSWRLRGLRPGARPVSGFSRSAIRICRSWPLRTRSRSASASGCAAARDHRHEVGAGAAGAQRRLRVAPGVQPQLVDAADRSAGAAPAGSQCWRLAKNTDSGSGVCGAGPRDELLVVQRERRLAGGDLEREPGARLVALVQVVVHQPRMAGERDALARGGEVGLAHHAVLVVAELVGGGGEEVDQHLVVVGLAGALPARHALGHRRHQRVAERVVVLGQVVDRRAGLRPAARAASARSRW